MKMRSHFAAFTLVLLLAAPLVAQAQSDHDSRVEPAIHIPVRYYNWIVPEGIPWTETNTGFNHLQWEIPIDKAALVLLDVWDHHYLEDTDARVDSITRELIAPLVEASREAGLQVIHTPGPRTARRYPEHLWTPDRSDAAAGNDRSQAGDTWPPTDFRRRRGEFARYSKPAVPPARAEALQELGDSRIIHPAVAPVDAEPVIMNGEDLHQYLHEEGILFLFYVGFHPNACIITRDYGALQMGARGYDVILLRDAGTAMEAAHTQERMEQTHNAYLMLEMFGRYTSTTDDLKKGLPQALAN